MTTFEEDTVECYYNLKDYFTIKNIPFSATQKRPGGRGRGEIDLLAVEVGNGGRVNDAVHVEVNVSVSSSFPFVSKKKDVDEVWKLLKKFFISDADAKISKLLKGLEWRCQLISSDFDSKSRERLEKRLKELGAEVRFSSKDISQGLMKTRIQFNNKVKEIEIIPFSEILTRLKDIFKRKKLMKKSFQDSRLRAIQHLIKERAL